MWVWCWFCLIFLSWIGFCDRQKTRSLEAEVKKQGESIMLLYGSMQTNKVTVEAFMIHANNMDWNQDKINAALGNAIAIVAKEVIKQKAGGQ
jgi:hypothetical protein